MRQELLNRLSGIKLFLFDLEGVLLKDTNSMDEESLKKFISEIEEACNNFQLRNICMGIVTAHPKDKLINDLSAIDKCKVIATSVEKISAVEELAEKLNLKFENIFYIGDEVLDIPLLSKCGVSSAPKSAKRDVKRVVDITFEAQDAKTLIDDILVVYDKSQHM